jgi:hypothetical protein
MPSERVSTPKELLSVPELLTRRVLQESMFGSKLYWSRLSRQNDKFKCQRARGSRSWRFGDMWSTHFFRNSGGFLPLCSCRSANAPIFAGMASGVRHFLDRKR